MEDEVKVDEELKTDVGGHDESQGEVKEEHKKKKSKHDSIKSEFAELEPGKLLEKAVELYEKNKELERELEESVKVKEEKEKESLDYLDRYRRSLAEVENVRRRTQQEKQENLKYANFNIITDLLTILDDFERALEHGKAEMEDVSVFIQGVEMIENQLSDLLFKKYGVTKYGGANDEFDPNIHQAVMMEEGDFDKELVVDVFRKGFMLHERVIRPAQVKIGKPKN